MKKSIKHLNWYYAVDVLAVLFVILFVLVLFTKNNKMCFALLGIDVALALTFLEIEFLSKNPPIPSKVTNNMDEPILAKPETENAPVQIAPYSEMYSVDGVKVNGNVFKICSGTHVEVKANGEIVTKALSAKFINKTRGGYIDQSPDPNWDELFNA